MRNAMTAAVAAMTLVGGLAIAGTASADRYRHRNNNDAAAAAIAGFALGAAIGGNSRGYVGPAYSSRGYYDRGYYRARGYGRGFYAPPRCWTERYWDPYYGRVSRRVCNR